MHNSLELRQWWNQDSQLRRFGRVLVQAKWIDTCEDLLEYFENPWKWDPEHNIWLEHREVHPPKGVPAYDEPSMRASDSWYTNQTERWDAFVNALEEELT